MATYGLSENMWARAPQTPVAAVNRLRSVKLAMIAIRITCRCFSFHDLSRILLFKIGLKFISCNETLVLFQD